MEKKKTDVLVVIDMQNDFITGSLGSPEAQAIVPKVAQLIRDGGFGLVVLTKDTHYADGEGRYADTLEGRMLPVAHCVHGTEGWRIADGIAEALQGTDHMEMCKETFGCFRLIDAVNPPFGDCGLGDIHICGLCTDICVVSNALILRAGHKDTRIVCHADCCAGVTPEKHKAALEVMRSCQIEIEGE